jgi:broad specificity phosphatase PhoE
MVRFALFILDRGGIKVKRIITVQHCQAVHHVNKMVGGVTDWELTELGKEQANNIGIALREKIGINSDYKIYSSDLIRTRQTADIIAKHLNMTPIYHQELREINLGSATGKSQEWFKANQIPRPSNMPWIYHKVMLDAESAEEVYYRVSKLVDEIENSNDENIIIVGHGGSLSLFTACWLKLTILVLEKTALLGSAGGVSFMSERDDNARVLDVWNDTSYFLSK